MYPKEALQPPLHSTTCGRRRKIVLKAFAGTAACIASHILRNLTDTSDKRFEIIVSNLLFCEPEWTEDGFVPAENELC